jgi:hypothetical protein
MHHSFGREVTAVMSVIEVILFRSIVEVTGLAPVEVLLGLLLGGLSIAFGTSGAIGFGAEWDTGGKFYRRAVIKLY